MNEHLTFTLSREIDLVSKESFFIRFQRTPLLGRPRDLKHNAEHPSGLKITHMGVMVGVGWVGGASGEDSR